MATLGETALNADITTPKSVSVAFTDGDTARRVTVSDANITTSSKIAGTIRRPDNDDTSGIGHVYLHQIEKIQNGSFDLTVICTDNGDPDTELLPPNETITFFYTHT